MIERAVTLILALATATLLCAAAGDTLTYPPRVINVNSAYSEQERRAIERHYYGGLNLIDDLVAELNQWKLRYGKRKAWQAFADSVQHQRAALAAELNLARKMAQTGYDPKLPQLDQWREATELTARRRLESIDTHLHLRSTVDKIRDQTSQEWQKR